MKEYLKQEIINNESISGCVVVSRLKKENIFLNKLNNWMTKRGKKKLLKGKIRDVNNIDDDKKERNDNDDDVDSNNEEKFVLVYA